MHYIVGIDPGNEQSAYCIVDEDLRPVHFGKMINELMYEQMVKDLQELSPDDYVEFAIERIASYGMPVGATVLDTCVWIGQLKERLRAFQLTFIFRKQEAVMLCHSARGNDATIKQALIDRFAKGVPHYGKGSKKNPGWFYGFRADIWAAYAIAVTKHDLDEEEGAA